MSEVVDLLLLFVLVASLSFLVTRSALSAKRVRTTDLELADGQVFRLLTTSGNYRSHLITTKAGSMRVSAPLHRDSHVPLRVGESVVVQSPGFDSLLTFRTTVIERDSDTHELTLAPPTSFRRTDRRCEPRLLTVQGQPAAINKGTASLCDLSAWGAKLTTGERVAAGDYVSVELPSEFGEAHGYALEVRTTSWEGRLCSEVRIRFEEPLSGLLSRRSGRVAR